MHTVIIGSGTAGVTLANRLLSGPEKHTVTLLELGDTIEQLNRRVWLDYVAGKKGTRGRVDPYREHKENPSDYMHEGESVVLQLHDSRYFGTGGSTNAWGGWCLRYKPEDFVLYSNAKQGIDWPYGYDVLEPYYHRAEHTLWVAGEGKPNPPLPYTMKDGVLIETLKQMDVSYEPLPLARKEGCATIGTCKYCPIGMRYAPVFDLKTLVKKYSSRFSVVPLSFVTRLVMSNKAECGAVEYKDLKNGGTQKVDCDRAIVAAGAIESPKLLLASADSCWKNGVGNDSGHVGKHITAHPLVRVVGERPNNQFDYEQPIDFPTLACREYDDVSHQPVGKLFFVRDGRTNAVAIEEELRRGRTVEEIRKDMRDSLPFELRGFIEVFSDPNHFVDIQRDAKSDPESSSFKGYKTHVQFAKTELTNRAIGRAEGIMEMILKRVGCKNIRFKTYNTIRADHATSTCRMSDSENDGVVDKDLRVHGTDNVFVCSNAVLPNGSAVNPTLTLVALAEKLGEHLE